MTVEHPSLAAALVAALADLVAVQKGRQANAGSYSYTYADIGDLIGDTRPVLAEHGLVALTPVHGHEGRLACTVELIHVSGETKTFEPLPFPEGRDAQATGSWITYFRRYALLAALGMATTDDDGAEATVASRHQPTAPDDAVTRFDPEDRSTWPTELTTGQAKAVLVAHHDGDRDQAAAMWAQLDVPSPITAHWLGAALADLQPAEDAPGYDEAVPA